MNILGLSQETNDALKTATFNKDQVFVIKTGETLGGEVYTDLCEVYGSKGIRVSMIGGDIFVTAENDAYSDIDELLLQENGS